MSDKTYETIDTPYDSNLNRGTQETDVNASAQNLTMANRSGADYGSSTIGESKNVTSPFEVGTGVVGTGNIGETWFDGWIKSINYIPKKQGVYMDGLRGYFEAVDVYLSGTIIAASGTIGGWAIGPTALTGGNTSLDSSGKITVGTGNDVVVLSSVDTTYRMWVGHATASSAPFSVTKEGAIRSISGLIGGFTIKATTLGSNATDANATVFLDSTNSLIRVGATTGNYLNLDGANLRIRSSNYVSGYFGAGFTLEPNLLEVGNIVARGMIRTSVFQKDTISVIGGSFAVLDGDTLDADMTALDSSTMTIKGTTTFAVGDILRIKDGTDDEWFEVTNIASKPIYTVTRDKSGNYSSNANPAWTKGASVINYRQSGNGGVYMTASEITAPYLSIFDHAGSPWSTINTRLRLGNLNGFLGYTTDLYGIAIGDNSAYLKYDKTNGLRVAGDITISNPEDINTSDLNNDAGWTDDTVANSKRRIFTVTPTTPYEVGDLWTGLSAADIKVCTTARLTGAYTAGDWVLASKYTDDTVANAQKVRIDSMDDDEKIAPSEKLDLKRIWEDIIVEGTPTTGTLPVQALALGVSDVNFDTKYAALDTYLNTTLAIFVDMTTDTTIVRATWNTKWNDYYNERTLLINAMAAKAATLAAWAGISNIPTTLTAPSGDGLYLSSTYMGFFKSSAWKTYIDNAGNMILGDIAGGNTGLSWSQSAGTLSIKGTITILNPSDIDQTTLSNAAAAGADVTLSAINGGLSITGGGITLDAGGALKGGMTDYFSGLGFFLGYHGGDYKFSIGNSAGNYMTWDGTYLKLKGSFDVGAGGIINNSTYTVGNLPISPTSVGFNNPSAFE